MADDKRKGQGKPPSSPAADERPIENRRQTGARKFEPTREPKNEPTPRGGARTRIVPKQRER